jgi:general secretion pathway protein J
MHRSNGFTLLEVLVAMAIFSVVGLGANQMLRTVIDTHQKTKVQIKDFSDLSRAFTILERDMSQTVPRSIRDEYGDPLPPLMLSTGPYFIEFTRTGWSNPIGLARSNLQRVAYDLNEEGQLERNFWLVLDRAEDSEAITQIILSGVEDFRINLISEDGESTDVWPDSDTARLIPVAAEVILQTKAYGELRKVFNFVDTLAPISDGQLNNPGEPGDAGSSLSGDPEQTEARP